MNKSNETSGYAHIEDEMPAGTFLGQALYPATAQMMAVSGTNDYAVRYLAERCCNGDRTPAHTTAFFALGRLQMLADEGLSQLAGLLTESEWLALQNAFPGHVFDIPAITYLFSDFCDYFGWESDDDVPVDLRALAAKLRNLSLFQRWALADAIERFWQFIAANSGRQMSLREAASEIGLKLRGE